MVAEFEADLIRARTRESMAVAKAKGLRILACIGLGVVMPVSICLWSLTGFLSPAAPKW